MLGADEGDLIVAIAVVFGEIKDPLARCRAVKEGREVLRRMADGAVAECRLNGTSWRSIAIALGEAHTTSYRHHGKTEPVQEVGVGVPDRDGDGRPGAIGG